MKSVQLFHKSSASTAVRVKILSTKTSVGFFFSDVRWLVQNNQRPEAAVFDYIVLKMIFYWASSLSLKGDCTLWHSAGSGVHLLLLHLFHSSFNTPQSLEVSIPMVWAPNFSCLLSNWYKIPQFHTWTHSPTFHAVQRALVTILPAETWVEGFLHRNTILFLGASVIKGKSW